MGVLSANGNSWLNLELVASVFAALLVVAILALAPFHEWGRQYGPIIGLKFGPANVVILNNYRDVQELLEKRSGIYSSRPPNYIANSLICPDNTHILFAPYNAGWKALRKSVQALFVAREISNMLPIQCAEATQTAYDMLCNPEGYYQHIQRYTTAVILASVFGQRGEKFESPKVQALYDVQYRFTALLEPGATPPIVALPFLKYLPEFAAPWKTTARDIRRDHRALYFRLMNETKERMSRGKGTGCFMEKLIQNQEKSGLDDEHVAYLGGILMEAGSDTTSSTLLSFLLGMLTNKDAVKQAQDEVDRRCGVDRSPSIRDLGSLPYTEACMNETLRWRPVAAGGIPHMLTETDSYKGYVFPAGTVFFANTWAIHHDENEYVEPDKFNPNRWLENKYGTRVNDTAAYESEQRKVTYSWGNGRRICSGQKLAENSLRIVIAKLVWAFEFEAGSEEDVDTSPLTGYQGRFVIAPKQFPISIRPRSEKHAEVLRDEFRDKRAFFDKFVTI